MNAKEMECSPGLQNTRLRMLIGDVDTVVSRTENMGWALPSNICNCSQKTKSAEKKLWKKLTESSGLK